MRQHQVAAGLALLATMVASLQAQADFTARGRAKKPAPSTAARGPSVAAKPGTPAQVAPRAALGSSAALIERYTALALQQPDSPFPIERLAQLYRERDGDLNQLIAGFEARARAPGGETWNARLVLAAIYEQAGKLDLTLETYKALALERPASPLPPLALARLYSARGDLLGARSEYEKALASLKDDIQIEQVRRTLRGLCLDAQDFATAQRYQDALVAQAHGSFFVRTELARELLNRGHDERAETEYRKLVRAASGDNRALGSALQGLGAALAKEHKYPEALETLQRAMSVAADSGLRREILLQSAALYRATDRTTDLIAQLEKQGAADFDSLRLLADLYEESGQLDKAVKAYNNALRRQPRDVAARLKLIQLLQLQGRLDDAIAEYERLIRLLPGNTQFVFQLAEARMQRGERDKALQLLQSLEARSPRNTRGAGDNDALQTLIDFYERMGEDARALALLERITAEGQADANSFIELGNRYFKAGDTDRAERTWRRVLQAGSNGARAWQTLGDVYLEHDKTEAALDAFRRAMKLAPNDQQLRKAYASALERGASALPRGQRLQQYEEAQKVWQQLLSEQAAPADPLAREAREHIVTLWSLSGDLSQRLRPLDRRLHQTPPDLEAGKLLADAQIRLRRYADAESTLKALQRSLPGDRATHVSLERVLVLQHKLSDAIAVLESLSRIDPQRAREYYQRMAQYAGELYQDDRALQYAARVVELSPDDADSHLKLAELYRRRQNTTKAIESLRVAISKNERLFPAYLELAELLLNRNEFESADQLLRRAATLSADDEWVARALRLSIQINLGRNTLESLEKELLPLALANPNRAVYRRSLVEAYGALCLPLAAQSETGSAAARQAATVELERIGQRAVKPLLDALADSDESQQRTAIELLSKLHNPSAAPALFAYAAGTANPVRRARALIAASTLVDSGKLLAELRRFLFQKGVPNADDGDPVVVAAAWALARSHAVNTVPALRQLSRASGGNVKALAILGLGLSGDQTAVSQLHAVAFDENEQQIVRAAAAYSLSALNAKQFSQQLQELSSLSDPDVRSTVLLALARLGAPGVEQRIAEALLSSDDHLEQAAWAAALLLTTPDREVQGGAFDVPAALVDVREVLHGLIPHDYSPDDETAALLHLAAPLGEQALVGLRGSSEQALRVIEFLTQRSGPDGGRRLTPHWLSASPPAQAQAQRVVDELATALVAPIAALMDHPLHRVRVAALAFLGTRKEPTAQDAVLRALTDPDPQLQQAALQLSRGLHSRSAAATVAQLLHQAPDWSLRVQAAQALGQMQPIFFDDSARNLVVNALGNAAQADSYALVRQAALEALSSFDSTAARPALSHAVQHDPEAQVRQRAQNLLLQGPSPGR